MWRRVVGLVFWLLAAAWPVGGKILPEFLRSLLCDRIIQVLGSFLGTYGPSIALAGVGICLFWQSAGDKSKWTKKRGATENRVMPMHEVVSRVAARIGDDNSEKFWPTARRAIRQAALDGEIQIFGHKSEDTGRVNGTSWSLVSTPIPRTYWELADITETATYAGYADELMHSTREHQLSDGRFTNEKIAHYAKLTARYDEINEKWP